ncbi:MAG TPA: hypothetical protein VL981_11800 [Candidatus Methylacidiphilales bacterium]|nr:hypothetical protein [Candidatus Methylacidiphilales bacterium]
MSGPYSGSPLGLGAPHNSPSFSSHMDAPPNSGVPPYSDDSEASGNPARAWYN